MKKNVLINFGHKIRKERLKKKLSQEKLAEIAGVHRTYIGVTEIALENNRFTNVEKIAKALKLDISKLFKD